MHLAHMPTNHITDVIYLKTIESVPVTIDSNCPDLLQQVQLHAMPCHSNCPDRCTLSGQRQLVSHLYCIVLYCIVLSQGCRGEASAAKQAVKAWSRHTAPEDCDPLLTRFAWNLDRKGAHMLLIAAPTLTARSALRCCVILLHSWPAQLGKGALCEWPTSARMSLFSCLSQLVCYSG